MRPRRVRGLGRQSQERGPEFGAKRVQQLSIARSGGVVRLVENDEQLTLGRQQELSEK